MNAHIKINLALQDLFTLKKVLLLQGPVGPLFGKLARGLRAKGISVSKVCFSAGDAIDWRASPQVPVHHFRAPFDEWSAYLSTLLIDQSFEAIVLFGQARRYHLTAIGLAQTIGIKIFVLEEGYFRPGYVTLESNGVNAYSTAMTNTEDMLHCNSRMPKPMPETVPWHFGKMAWAAAIHYLAMFLGKHRYPHYIHHRKTSPLTYAVFWLRSWYRKARRWHEDNALISRLVQQDASYFFVPLQNPNDSQIHLHSRFLSIKDFIDEVLHSFATHAPAHAQLLFKEHPMNRGGLIHDQHINRAAKNFGIADRVHYVTEAHNPTVLDHCQGVVLINSTIGIQAIARLLPVKVLGESLYDRPGLTDQQALDSFWSHPNRPSVHVLDWLRLLKCRTQVPCSMYALNREVWKAIE